MCVANTILQVHPASNSGDESNLDMQECSLQSWPAPQQVVEELKESMRIAGPLAVANGIAYARLMVSVLCLGRLGGLELAGGALSIGFTNITGYSVLYGLASGMDPICSQAVGSKNWHVVGLTLQRTVLILLAACLPIGMLWTNLGPIMLFLGQDPAITAVASVYCWYSLPDLVANCLLQPLRNYYRCQGFQSPMMYCAALGVVLHIPLSIVFTFVFRLGVPGVAIAASMTNINVVILMLLYVKFSGAFKKTWGGVSPACVREWWPVLSLALPSCLQICLEWWWYEIMTILAGYLPNPQVAVAATAILIQTTALMYTIPMSLGSAVSTRVGNELGANRPERARNASLVSLGVAFLVAIVSVIWTTVFRKQWGTLYTVDASVLALTAAALPLIGLCELGNCPQTAGCGILRGSARPTITASIMFGSFYLVGTPVAVISAFWLRIGFQGLWYGLLAAQICCACAILFITLRINWIEECARANKLTRSEVDSASEMSKLVNHKIGPILGADSDELSAFKLELSSIVSIAEEQAGLLVDGNPNDKFYPLQITS
uniref:Protein DETOXIFICATION n=2 Tax=Physcomitrium patens TaxID=3218 RepID=A0A7I3ZYA6_PHYPA